jgi:hypothetical protein
MGFIVAAAMLAAFALPASAAKQISLTMDTDELPTVVYATIDNIGSNSTANSFRVRWESAVNNFNVTSASIAGGTTVPCETSLSGLTGQCTFNNQPPLKPSSIPVTIQLITTVTDPCMAFELTWSAFA